MELSTDSSRVTCMRDCLDAQVRPHKRGDGSQLTNPPNFGGVTALNKLTANTAVSNTAAEISLSSYSVPGGTLGTSATLWLAAEITDLNPWPGSIRSPNRIADYCIRSFHALADGIGIHWAKRKARLGRDRAFAFLHLSQACRGRRTWPGGDKIRSIPHGMNVSCFCCSRPA
jgi:hypothetical protein